MFKFATPYFLILLLPIVYLFFRKTKTFGIKIPGIEPIRKFKIKTKKYLIGKFLFFISCVLMTFALARPQFIIENKVVNKNGIDIGIAFDLSQSMLINDFSPNRLEKAKELLNKFIEKRNNDRISVVVFAGDAYTKVPLTFDHSIVNEIVKNFTVDDILNNNRTAIGTGLATTVNRLKDSKAKEKIIILLTDGANNSGDIAPIDAAKLAKELGIKIYPIGIGGYNIPQRDIFGFTTSQPNTELDEVLLKDIAKITGGEYFRASDEKEFQNIFNKIDKLEKTKIEARSFHQENDLFKFFIIGALISLLLGVLFEFLIYIKIP